MKCPARLLLGDCLERMAELADSSVDAVVTDPPAGIGFMGKKWDEPGSLVERQPDRSVAWDRVGGNHNPCNPTDAGRTNRAQGARFREWLTPRMAECYRIAKPGAYALVWALPRTSHWTGTAIEDAGWTIRDRVSHLFGQGFPKAKSCLKPACEDWWLAWKPAARATPLNIDDCRIESGSDYHDLHVTQGAEDQIYGGGSGLRSKPTKFTPGAGRWPANVVLSHSPDCRQVGTKRIKGANVRGISSLGARREDRENWRVPNGTTQYVDDEGMEVVEAWECAEGCPAGMLDRQSGTLKAGVAIEPAPKPMSRSIYGATSTLGREVGYGDSGGASRFFYTAKASKSDRGEGNTHPTVKSTALMRWLCRLITPPGGTILDPFMGSGSTGKATVPEGFGFIGIERDPGYFAIAEARIKAALESEAA